MPKITLPSTSSGTAFKSSVDANFQAIEDALNDKIFWRDNPEGEPNTIKQDVDLDSSNLLNVNVVNADVIAVGTGDPTAEAIQAAADAELARDQAATYAADAQLAVDELAGEWLGGYPDDATAALDANLTLYSLYYNTTIGEVRLCYQLSPALFRPLNIDPASLGSAAYTDVEDYTRPVANLTALQTLNSVVDGDTAIVKGVGTFTFDDSDLSASVTFDVDKLKYVAPASDLTGASGAWVKNDAISAYVNYVTADIQALHANNSSITVGYMEISRSGNNVTINSILRDGTSWSSLVIDGMPYWARPTTSQLTSVEVVGNYNNLFYSRVQVQGTSAEYRVYLYDHSHAAYTASGSVATTISYPVPPM